MSKNYTVNILSTNSIQRLIRQLEKYRDGLFDKANLLARRLAEEGVMIAGAQIVDLDAVFTGELLKSVRMEEQINNVFAIVTDSEHACFVEFGTGQRGMDSPYPFPLPEGVSWKYINPYSGKIRHNPVTGNYYWFYPGLDGKWHYTEGMPARPFMYNTSLELQKIIVDVAREVFGNNVGK